ncbi:MAG TPA: hypothetical protein QGF01_00615 [Candidatus Nitrosopelagicus sp.]|jgi:hypothetical protein|nr:hypothetical protein [Candidatus Nitrosopelagicus sp.]|tara:strand:- start:371 stop:1039 length:669 start_codon:yes stop_codon:yes gene_type:complete
MKIAILLAISVLILSQGYGMAYGEKLTLSTDSSSYEKGTTIEVSGLISDFDTSDPLKVYQITLRVVDPKNNIVTVSQFDPNDDGTFSTSINSDGPTWKFDGDYVIMLNYGELKGTYTFAFSVPAPGSEIIDEAGDVIDAGVDVIDEAVDVADAIVEEVSGALQCGPGTTDDGGICIIDKSGSFNPQVEEGTFYAMIIPTAIAFGIGMAVLVALALIARAHRK